MELQELQRQADETRQKIRVTMSYLEGYYNGKKDMLAFCEIVGISK